MHPLAEYLINLNVAQGIGVLGFICYISLFSAVQLGRMDGNSTVYSLGNVIAASLVAISLLEEFNLSAALIQGSWIVIGLIGLMLRVHKAWNSTRTLMTTTLDHEV